MWLSGSKMPFHVENTATNPGSSTGLVSFQGNKGVIIPWLLPEVKNRGEGSGNLSNSWVKFCVAEGFFTLSAFHRSGYPGLRDGGTAGTPWDSSWVSPAALPHPGEVFFQVQETLPGAPNQSGASPMRDAVLCGCFPQQLRVPTGNRGFPAQIWERGRRTARAGPSTSPGTRDVTRDGFSHLVHTHFQTQHFIFLLFPGSEDGFPPSQGPRSNKLPCSIMGMVNLDLSSRNTSFPARSNSK